MSTTTETQFPPVRACLFDMDGLLIDTEDIYSEVTNTILRECNRPELPWSIKYQLQGRPGNASRDLFMEWAKLPMTPEAYTARMLELQAQLFPKCSPLPGVVDLLKTLKASNVELALATSSNLRNYKAKIGHLPHLFDHIPVEHRITGDDPRVELGRGKPAPDIYLVALEIVNRTVTARGERPILPEECLVFEDAIGGVEAGRRAGMRVVWVPHPGLASLFKGREEEVLAGLTGEIERDPEQAKAAAAGTVGQPGKIGDGWGECRSTLRNFNYEKYGIQVPPVEPRVYGCS